jgi:hypothetical protein
MESFFDVVRVDRDADFSELCRRHRPDLVVVEDGAERGPCLRPDITNKNAYPEIPRVGLLTCDPFSPARPVFFSEMAEWGISTFFVFSILTGVYTPAVRDQIFYWPQFVDGNLFRDYKTEKVIPVLLTGKVARGGLDYSWRRNVFHRLTDSGLPVMNVPHPGYATGDTNYRVYGEHYARLINASMIAPTCGSVTNGLVMKHLEIPAAKCCLITENTPAVQEFGFIDMKNCVFATPDDVVAKTNHLLQNPDKLKQITQNGFDLVHQNHTILQRSQLRDWAELARELRPGQRIVQSGLLAPLKLVDEDSDQQDFHLEPNGPVSKAIRNARRSLETDKIARARSESKTAQAYIPWFPEPEFIDAIASLKRKRVRRATQLLASLLKRNLFDAGARRPDPVEWAYFLIALAAVNSKDVSHYDRLFATLSHPELDEIRTQLYRAEIEHSSQFVTPSIHHMWAGNSKSQRRDRISKLLKLNGVTGSVSRVAPPETPDDEVRRSLEHLLEDQSAKNSRRGDRSRAIKKQIARVVRKSVSKYKSIQQSINTRGDTSGS